MEKTVKGVRSTSKESALSQLEKYIADAENKPRNGKVTHSLKSPIKHVSFLANDVKLDVEHFPDKAHRGDSDFSVCETVTPHSRISRNVDDFFAFELEDWHLRTRRRSSRLRHELMSNNGNSNKIFSVDRFSNIPPPRRRRGVLSCGVDLNQSLSHILSCKQEENYTSSVLSEPEILPYTTQKYKSEARRRFFREVSVPLKYIYDLCEKSELNSSMTDVRNVSPPPPPSSEEVPSLSSVVCERHYDTTTCSMGCTDSEKISSKKDESTTPDRREYIHRSLRRYADISNRYSYTKVPGGSGGDDNGSISDPIGIYSDSYQNECDMLDSPKSNSHNEKDHRKAKGIALNDSSQFSLSQTHESMPKTLTGTCFGNPSIENERNSLGADLDSLLFEDSPSHRTNETPSVSAGGSFLRYRPSACSQEGVSTTVPRLVKRRENSMHSAVYFTPHGKSYPLRCAAYGQCHVDSTVGNRSEIPETKFTRPSYEELKKVDVPPASPTFSS
eukprot:CAMPEP_0185040346 /NCGR_PEP_ID=MMETSP1103-20130426/38302_1 /TAXON_ID=36769 /ORGANISM="Paraphysomonas bandaiensis, Strain Caron Lab Isolate" /LENGTH=500 /DNA_ID=CAMNT_0027579609 /DNA_START=101 /DNA_END=1599 /DNA_ORIENTATION=-